MLRFLTAGESHGPGLTAIVEGFPAGVSVDTAFINEQLKLSAERFDPYDAASLGSALRHMETAAASLPQPPREHLESFHWGTLAASVSATLFSRMQATDGDRQHGDA